MNLADVVHAHIPFLLKSQKDVHETADLKCFSRISTRLPRCVSSISSHRRLIPQPVTIASYFSVPTELLYALADFTMSQELPVHIDVCDVHRLNQCAQFVRICLQFRRLILMGFHKNVLYAHVHFTFDELSHNSALHAFNIQF